MQIGMQSSVKKWWRESTNCWVVEVEIQLDDEQGYYNIREPWPIGTRPSDIDVLNCYKKALMKVLDDAMLAA